MNHSTSRMVLEDGATASVCACYVYELADWMTIATDEELQEVVDDGYKFHIEDGSLKECPGWLQERDEAQADQQINEMRGK